MGLLKNLQDANPDDHKGDGALDGLVIDGDFVQVPDASASPTPKPDQATKVKEEKEKVLSKELVEVMKELGGAIEEGDPQRIVNVWLYQFVPLLAKSSELAELMKDMGEAIEEGDPQRITDIWLHQFIPLLAKNTEPVDDPLLTTTNFPARRPGEHFSEPYNRKLFAKMAGVTAAGTPVAPQSQIDQAQPSHGTQAGGGQADLLTQALSAPFAIMATAGSLVINGLKAAGDKARGFYVKGRENGHAILGQQLDESAGNIASMTAALKQRGMGELIADMRATGRPAREIFQGMAPGGPHQHFSDRFSSLMKNESFAQQYAKLEDSLSDFGFKASHYAQMGVELNLDHSDAIERNLEKISTATEGFIFKKDGVIKHLQELARSISERIGEMINNLLGRHKPQ